MRRGLILLALLAVTLLSARAQTCPNWDPAGPDIPSISRFLEGRLLYHDDLRQWFELKLDHAECGQDAVQLVTLNGSERNLERLRGCRVRSVGPLGDAGTGYFSLNVYQDVRGVVAEGACIRKRPFPDYSHARPAASVRRYRVDMQVNYGAGDHPVLFTVTSGGRVLKPWQAYASYYLTGGFGLNAYCGKSFEVAKVFGTPEAEPMLIDNAMFQPQSAAAAGVHHLHLGYTCVR